MRIVVSLVAASLFAVAAHADEIYKWVDKDGRVHYGDRPKDTPAEQVTTDRPGFDAEPVTPEERAAAAGQQAACAEQREKYERYKAAGTIKQTDAFGETRDFTAEEQAKFVEMTRQKMVAACSTQPPAPATEVAAEAGDGPADDNAADDDFDDEEDVIEDEVDLEGSL